MEPGYDNWYDLYGGWLPKNGTPRPNIDWHVATYQEVSYLMFKFSGAPTNQGTFLKKSLDQFG